MAQLNQRTQGLLRRLVRRDASAAIRKLVTKTRPEDLAAAMEHLTWSEQRRLHNLIDDLDYKANVVANLSDGSILHVLQDESESTVVDLLDRMEPDDATDVVEVLPDELRSRVIEQLGSDDSEAVRELLEWPSDSAGGIMSPLVFKMMQTATTAQAIAQLQREHDNFESVHYLYLIDGDDRLVGVTSLRSLLTHAPDTPLVAYMSREVIQVGPRTDQEEVARFVARYDLLAVPVVDGGGHILGIVTVDDVLDVIRDEAAEDMMLMAGVSEGPAAQGPLSQTFRRAGWLMATTIGGILMAEIIGAYKATLETVAVLAGFIPVIMGMGGNVGIQSATVAVRGLATGHVQVGGAMRFVLQEAQVGVLLGILFAVLLGAYGGIRFGFGIGGSVALSVALSIAAASAIGAAIPVLLSRLGADPAIATGPFVTTAVDILAILIYFNIARILLGSDRIAGVVVGHVDLGEADRIIRLLTPEEGRISLMARGARSSRKRFGGVLDLGSRVKIVRSKGRGRLARIVDVELVNAVNRARTEIERVALLAYGCEITGRLAGEDVPAPRLARLLVVWLELLEGEARPGTASRQALEGKGLTFAGLLPSLVTCAGCGQELEGACVVAPEVGMVHAACGPGSPVHADDLARLELLRRTPLFDTPAMEPSGAGWALADFAQYQLSSPLKSRGLLADLALP